MARPTPRTLHVIGKQAVSRNMLRVTLGGEGMQAFPDDQAGAYIKLIFPATAEQPSAASSGDTHAPNRDAVMNSDSSNDRPWNKESKEKGGKRYGLE